MNKRTNFLFSFLIALFIISSLLFIVLNDKKSLTTESLNKKELFVKIVGLPDLAISTEVNYIRHRSLTDINSIFKDGPEHIEYAPSTFVIHFGIK